MSQSRIGVMPDGNMVLHSPKIKLGPQFEQNPNICSASCFESSFRRYASPIAFAPTGYPPRIPVKNITSAPAGTPKTDANFADLNVVV